MAGLASSGSSSFPQEPTRVVHVQPQRRLLHPDLSQCRTVNGALKVSVIILTIIGAILAGASVGTGESGCYVNLVGLERVCVLGAPSFATFAHLSVLLQTLVYLVIVVFGAHPFPPLELTTGGIGTLLLLIAGCIMIPGAMQLRSATAFFSWAAALALGVDWIIKFRQFRQGRFGAGSRHPGVVFNSGKF